ncbi:FxLD family lanthipeptide [Streptomyces sp. NPDC006326]|uniref:FxLD family lanthipeptide n=1 Tax=Streptomyces sp. NPDC006326 TaxID=3156752 RepID=UPI0033A2D362
MAHQIQQATTCASEFDLDVRVVEAGAPIASLLQDTGDGCGSTCANGATACVSLSGDAA